MRLSSTVPANSLSITGMSAIYVQKGDKRSGPFTESELERLVETGEYSGEDTFWVEGMEEWLPLSSVIEMVPMEEAAPPAQPPLPGEPPPLEAKASEVTPAAPVVGEPPPPEPVKATGPEIVPPELPGEPPPREAGKAPEAKGSELEPSAREPAPAPPKESAVEPPPPPVLRGEADSTVEVPKAPPPVEVAPGPLPPPPEVPVAKVEAGGQSVPPPVAAEPKEAIPAPPLIAAKETPASSDQASPAPPATGEPAARAELASTGNGILFERDGVLVTREDLEIDGETFPISSIQRTETHVEHVRRFGSVFGSVVLGVVVICVAFVPIPRTTLVGWVIWGMILGALVIWWFRCLYSALRAARSHVDIIFRDGTERVISTNPGDAKKLSAAIDDALAVPQAA